MLRLRSVITGLLRAREAGAALMNTTSTSGEYPSIEIPVYPVERPQPLEHRKARLLYQSRKRGMLENDLLLSTFAGKYLEKFSEEQTMMYDRLINSPSNDWDIYYWIVGTKPTPKEFDNEIMDLIKKHAQNDERVLLKQPDLK